MSGEDAPRPYLENLIVPEIETYNRLRAKSVPSFPNRNPKPRV
jgi:hypothetical protein